VIKDIFDLYGPLNGEEIAWLSLAMGVVFVNVVVVVVVFDVPDVVMI